MSIKQGSQKDMTEYKPPEGYVIAYDTALNGWQCEMVTGKDNKVKPMVYKTKEEAEAELLDDMDTWEHERDEAQMNSDSRCPTCMKPCEYCSETSDDNPYFDSFVVSTSEFIQGRKAIWHPNGGYVEGENPDQKFWEGVDHRGSD